MFTAKNAKQLAEDYLLNKDLSKSQITDVLSWVMRRATDGGTEMEYYGISQSTADKLKEIGYAVLPQENRQGYFTISWI